MYVKELKESDIKEKVSNFAENTEGVLHYQCVEVKIVFIPKDYQKLDNFVLPFVKVTGPKPHLLICNLTS